MSITIKNGSDIEKLRVGGKRHARILRELAKAVRPGVTAKELDTLAEKLIREGGDVPSFLNYTPEGISYPYPASLCVSVNDEIVHGIPHEDLVLQEGDVVSLDMGVTHEGMVTDAAITVPVGKISKEAEGLLRVTQESLRVGIEASVVGNTTGDIGHAIESYIHSQGKFGIVRILAGHGVGYSVHEDPYIPNFGDAGEGEKLRAGMVIALEPMVTLGGDDAAVCEDEYTYVTEDGSLSAHFEHTILITENGPEILTQ